MVPGRHEHGDAAIERLPQLGRFTEVLFVEGHSSDHTWQEIERICATYQGPLRLRQFRQSGKGKADAVWLGFEQAEGEVLMILDADLTVRPEDLAATIYYLMGIDPAAEIYDRSDRPLPIAGRPILDVVA